MIKLNRPPCLHPDALINKNYKHQKNKEALKNASNDKCMYCESKISHTYAGDVEHIKPKAADKFPELEFEWDNHGYCCWKCNSEKSDKYFDGVEFINPYSEEPEHHLYAFGAFIFHKNGSERGDITIREIGLNRPELIEKRGSRISEVRKAIDACFKTKSEHLKKLALDELKQEANDDKEYSIVIKALLAANELLEN